MRLIDADALFAEIKERHDMFAECEYIGDKARRDELGAFMADIVNAPTVGGWISVEDQVPERGFLGKLICDNERQVSVCGSYCTYHVATGEKVFLPGHLFLDLLLQGEKKGEDAWNFTHITHWMELPEPPKEENRDEAD